MPYLLYEADQFWFSQNQMFLGTSEACTFKIEGEGVNLTHAVIEEVNGAFSIAGINRLNLVLVNGQKIKRQILKDQDRITIGQVTLVR